ncbi:fibronectin type III domain-containing protein [Streptomyces sp. NPDC048282]|uniref:fibronectin type III domain-containing protein n=1 Tax=Streptomyces sp. NPDC048282 TaxID=3365528 RepID=UPI0037160A4D
MTLALALALTVAGTALPDMSQRAAAEDAPGCSLNATSFDAESLGDADGGIRVGCAVDSGSLRSLANSDDDVVGAIDFNPKDYPDQLLQTMQEVVDTTRADQADGLSLAQSLVRRAQQVNVGVYPQQTFDDIDYDGTVQIIGNSLVFVVTAPDVGTTSKIGDWWGGFWKKFLTGLGVALAATAITAGCLALFNVGAAAAAPVCGALAGGISSALGEIISAALDKKPIDAEVWGAAMGTAVWGAVLGAFGGALVKFATEEGAALISDIQTTLKRWALSYKYWRVPLTFVANLFNSNMAAAFLARLQTLQRGVSGQQSSTLPSGTLKVMVVGDSMSQGREGDWTWRYRLWQWFISQGVSVDFVGPYKGTREPDTAHAPVPPLLQGEVDTPSGEVRADGTYAEGASAFDSDHFSVWGRQAAQDKNMIANEVARYQPDLLLVGLGFNDMGWFVSDADGTLESMKTLVDEARVAKPDIDIALANVPQRTHIGGRDDLPVKTAKYNDMLKDAIPSWSTDTSPVNLVDWAGTYECGTESCPAGYDGLHPNAKGEYEIAQAYERTLYEAWGIGSYVPAVPEYAPARPTPVPTSVNAESVPLGITLTWDKVYGARSYTVRYRVAGANWTETTVQTNRYDTVWTKDGWQWEYQVRTDNATDGQSDWSPVVTAVAHPQTAPPPVGIVTHATATGVDIAWGAPTGDYTDTIDRYQIIIWDKDTPDAYTEGTAVKGLSAHIDGLLPGHRYQVWVVTWNAAGEGWPGEARPVTIGAGTPEAPTGLQVTSTDGTTVKLTWNASSGAAGYRIWVRNINDGSASTADENATTMDTTSGVAYLFPGVWNYEFCVTAINGAAESGKSECVVAPKPPGY